MNTKTTTIAHPRWLTALSLPLLLAGLSCQGSGSGKVLSEPSPSGDPTTTNSPDAAQPAGPRTLALTRGVAPRGQLTEAVLDARGEVALSLDRFGGVLLWPSIRSGDASASSPLSLPAREPLWMSVGQNGAGRFTVALLDSSNAGQFGLVELGQGGEGPRYTELFTTPPSDPLLEVHVLDGGERILALGVDHSLRLYDREGALLSTIDERGFIPWQLRVTGGVGEAPHIAVVLAQPLRVQMIELDEDQLRAVGEARAVELDRGPNRNDLALSPDGTTVAALRRPKAKTRKWSIELLDLATGARELIAGRTDTLVRPRMHFVTPDKLLLESGSGKGFWVDLDEAVTPPKPSDVDPDSKFAKRLSLSLSHTKIRLPGSAEELWQGTVEDDRGARMHASVVNGVRVTFEHGKEGVLIVEPLDPEQAASAGTHLELGFPPLELHAAALDAKGERVAWASADALHVEPTSGDAGLRSLGHSLGEPLALYFVGDRLLHFGGPDSSRAATLLAVGEGELGEVVAAERLDLDWGVHAVDYQALGPDKGVLVYVDDKPSAPMRAIEVAGDTLSPIRSVEGDARDAWVHLRKLRAEAVTKLVEDAVGELPTQFRGEGIDEWARDSQGRWFLTEHSQRTPLSVLRPDGTIEAEVELPAGQGRSLVLSPDGSRLAVVQFRGDRFERQDLLVSIYTTDGFERLWTRGLFSRSQRRSDELVDVRWSGDGSRVAVLNSGDGEVYDTATGDRLAERETATLRVEEVAD
ncbi:hypothetical protein ENSA5_36870 [Enhygromyxa salina]|uniref:WD domain, G-beta repeat n=1 Tax=Enhygromyxa salina TaxID=215803 RepID=A0A2S9XSI3_9BACT|nr:hypothetical protein [Enhygromyxa salina]PRP95818.1 hypothetical protein ENSA5_36870 [Enhygromyxa salina]